MLCPCDSGQVIDSCCGPILDGFPAPDAEALMRSRYSAYALGNEDHLFRSWHPRTRPVFPVFDSSITWTGLRIVDFSPLSDEEAVVEFVASYREADGSSREMRERSRFQRRGGRWMYLDGDILS